MNKFRITSILVLLAMLFSFANVSSVSALNQYSAPIDGRVFEYVPVSAGISWEGARVAALALTYLGAPGRLATLDSQAVMDHVVAAFPVVSTVAPWIGAHSPTGSNNPNSGWLWVSGEPWAFTKWIPGEPSGWSGNPPEGATLNGSVGWNDVPPVFVQKGYIVEYDVAPTISAACAAVNALPYGAFYANHWAPFAGPYTPNPTVSTVSGFAAGDEITFWLTTQGHYTAQWTLYSGPTTGGAIVAQHTYNGPGTVPNPKSITYIVGTNANDTTLTQKVQNINGAGMTTAHPSYMTFCTPNPNSAPTADAGGPYSGNENSAIAMSGATASDPDLNTLTYNWSVDSVLCSFDDQSALNPDLTCSDNGSVTVTLEVNDGTAPAVSSEATVTVDNVAPIIAISGAGSVNEGSPYSLTLGAITDPGADTVSDFIIHWGDGSSNSLLTHTYADGPNNYNITVDLTDEDGTFLERSNDLSVTVDNVAPIIAISGAGSVNEGSPYSLILGAITDPGADTVSDFIIHWGDGSSDSLLTHTYADGPNNYNITVDLTDEDGTFLERSNDLSVTVNNVAPILGAISVDLALVPVDTAIIFSANFTDPGTGDTHSASWDWGDGTSAGAVTQGVGSGSVDNNHSYSVPGVYTVKLIVTDNDLADSNEAIYAFVVVYDPNGGFVTGGGWINSPAGAYKANPSLTGKASFGFVAKYKKGANLPDGNTQFTFKAGDLNFHSASYEWLVVAGNKAQFKGVGTINGVGSYMFKIWADDDNPDTFRIMIWGENGVIYDNGSQQSLGGGSIKVHK